jgi:glycerol-3-phosphate dehydrogenase (NAD+)
MASITYTDMDHTTSESVPSSRSSDIEMSEMDDEVSSISSSSSADLHATDKVAIIGSGNWGSAVGRIIGANVVEHRGFDHEVRQWVFEEKVQFEGQSMNLTEVINTANENIKYLPGIKLPENLIAHPDLAKAVEGATILVFVLPHQFLDKILPTIAQALSLRKGETTRIRAISLIKGVDCGPNGIKLISDKIRCGLSNAVPVNVLMGANVATEVAQEQFCETTVGLADLDYANLGMDADKDARILQRLFHRPYFRVTVVRKAAATVELCGALKNVVALGAAFCDGLGYGGNTKAAIVRTGMMEMRKFCKRYFAEHKDDKGAHEACTQAFFESCGVGDLMTTCYGGSRNRKCAEIFAREGGKRSWEQLEQDELGGMKLQGPSTAKETYKVLQNEGAVQDFPLLTTIYKIAYDGLAASAIVCYDGDHIAACC